MTKKQNAAMSLGIMTLALLFQGGLSVAAERTNACKEDAKKYCAEVKPGGGRIAQCLKTHEADLSEGCKNQIAHAKEQANEWAEACNDDKAKFCADTQPGGGRILGCLKQHESELSADCKAKIANVKKG